MRSKHFAASPNPEGFFTVISQIPRALPQRDMSLDKASIRAAVIAKLQSELLLQTQAAQLARDEATHEESRAESKYDTHSQEAAYLAEGQAKQAAEIEASIAMYTSLPLRGAGAEGQIALGALVELERSGTRSWYFLGPRSGGLELEIDGKTILVITPQSPLGRQMIGRRTGDMISAPGQRASMTQSIASVA